MQTFRLSADDTNKMHVINRKRALCGAIVGPAEFVAKGVPDRIGKLLHDSDSGCFKCMFIVIGMPDPTKPKRLKEREPTEPRK